MSNTRLYVGESFKNGKIVHVLAYQNAAETDGPNAMVLPFPTDVAMGPENIINTSLFKDFLKDITDASRLRTKGFGDRRGMMLGAVGGSADSLAQVFDSGSYTVVLADHVDQIPEALTRVPARKRPKVSEQFLEGYGELYPNQPIAVCCWNGSIEAEPLMAWYEPRDTSTLFIPTMDAHDGGAPKVGQKVDTDHIISVGGINIDRGNEVTYTQLKRIPNDVIGLLPTRVHGKRLPDYLENGDCFVKTAVLHSTMKDYYSHGAPAVELKRGYGTKMAYSTVMNGWT
jgi:hypothetical protein